MNFRRRMSAMKDFRHEMSPIKHLERGMSAVKDLKHGMSGIKTNSEGIEQRSKIAPLAMTMKLNDALSNVAEHAGVTDRVQIARKSSGLMSSLKILKDPKEDEGLTIRDTTIQGVPVRIVRPQNATSLLPAVVFFHGGAFYMGSPDTHNSVTSTLARDAHVVVVSVDYRLAPQHPYPAALQDCSTVVRHILEFGDSREYCIDPRRVALAGDSAGGNLAAVLSMHFATTPVNRHRPCLQVLIYPLLQCFDFTLPSYQEEHCEVYPYSIDYALSVYVGQKLDKTIFQNNHTTAQQKDQCRRLVDRSLIPPKFLGKKRANVPEYREGDPDLVQRANILLIPEISPLLVEDNELARLPRTYVLTVGHDRLRDEGLIYVERLRRCRVPVVHNHYKDTFHASITSLYGMTKLDIAQKMVADITTFLRDTFRTIRG